MANNGLALVSNSNALAMSGSVKIEGLADVFKLANVLSQAQGFVPQTYVGKPNAIAAAILMGIELNMGPMESLREVHIVNGRPGLSSGCMLARAIRAGVQIEWLEATNTRACIRLVRGGRKHEQAFDMDDAKRAKLTEKDVWKQYPGAMLRARAISAGVRAFCPDVIGGGGIYTPEELRDMDPEPEPRSSGSVEVRDLGAALHEVEEADEGAPNPFAPMLLELESCRTDGELRAWVRDHSAELERAPDDSRRRGVWAAMKQRARGVVPPVQVATVTQWFREEREARAAAGEVTPGAKAMDELRSVETRESALAWLDDNRDYLAGIVPGSSEENVVWMAIRKRVGDDVANEMEARMG